MLLIFILKSEHFVILTCVASLQSLSILLSLYNLSPTLQSFLSSKNVGIYIQQYLQTTTRWFFIRILKIFLFLFLEISCAWWLFPRSSWCPGPSSLCSWARPPSSHPSSTTDSSDSDMHQGGKDTFSSSSSGITLWKLNFPHFLAINCLPGQRQQFVDSWVHSKYRGTF